MREGDEGVHLPLGPCTILTTLRMLYNPNNEMYDPITYIMYSEVRISTEMGP